MNGDQLAIVLAATLPAAITTVGGIILARATKGMRDKVSETHHQVTVNSHSSDTPTVLDRLAEVKDAVAEVRADVAELRTDLHEHVEVSTADRQNLWTAVWYAFRGHRAAGRHELGGDELPEQREERRT